MPCFFSSKIDDETIKLLKLFGENLGLAFQIQDDILDIEGKTEIIGKPQGSDQEKNKTTYPSLLGLENAKKYRDELFEKILEILNPLEKRAAPLLELARFIMQREF